MLLVGWRTWTERQEQSSAYGQALAALSAGNLPEAIAQFGQAGGYRDAQEQRISTQQKLAPFQAALLDAQSALDHRDNQRAVELLRSVVTAMPDNQTASDLLAAAEQRFRADLARGISVATTNRDWLEVERKTLQLAFWDGSSPDESALEALRLAHAPILFTRNGALYQIGPDLADETLIFDQTPVASPLWSPDRSPDHILLGGARSGALRRALRHRCKWRQSATDRRNGDSVAARLESGWPAARLCGSSERESVRYRYGTSLLRLERCAGADAGAAVRIRAVAFSELVRGGDRLVVVATGQNGISSILMVDAKSLEARPVLESTLPDARAVSWSSSADTLLLWTTTGDSDWYALRGSAIYLISLADGSVLPITTATQAPSRPVWSPDGIHFAYLDRGSSLHVRIRTGIGESTLELPNKGSGVITWGPGGVGIMVPALDLADPSMLVPVGDRLGPVDPITVLVDDSFQATDFQWGPITVPDPALYDPLASPTLPSGGS